VISSVYSEKEDLQDRLACYAATPSERKRKAPEELRSPAKRSK